MTGRNDTVTLHVCPNGCKEATFITPAHVMQDWKVDALGTFIESVNDCLEVTHAPDNNNFWECSECGEEAEAVECLRSEINIPVGGLDSGAVRPTYLYKEAYPSLGKMPRAFTMRPGMSGVTDHEVFHDASGLCYIMVDDTKVLLA